MYLSTHSFYVISKKKEKRKRKKTRIWIFTSNRLQLFETWAILCCIWDKNFYIKKYEFYYILEKNGKSMQINFDEGSVSMKKNTQTSWVWKRS